MTNDVRYSDGEQEVVPLVEEQAYVAKLRVERGRVEVRTRVHTETESVETRLSHENYNVERVAVGRFVDNAPVERREGDTLIIPIVEEVAVVVKRLRLVAELRITRNAYTTPFQESVEVRRMRASVERTPANPPNTQSKD